MWPVVVIADSFKRAWYNSLWPCRHSHTKIAMTPKLSPTLFIRRNFITKWRFDFISTPPLPFSYCLSMFSGQRITARAQSLLTGGNNATPGRSRGNFTDSSSSSTQNGWLRSTPTPPYLTLTPRPCLWTFLINKCCIFHLRSAPASWPLRSFRGYNS